MDKLYYFLALVLIVAALIGMVFVMQKLQARKLRYWNEKRKYEMKLADQLQEEIQKSREA